MVPNNYFNYMVPNNYLQELFTIIFRYRKISHITLLAGKSLRLPATHATIIYNYCLVRTKQLFRKLKNYSALCEAL